MEPSDVGTPCRLRVARLTAGSVLERRTDLMDAHMQTAERVRQACIAAALQAYEDAGVSGLCHEGRWEYAVDAMRGLPLRPLVQGLLRAAEDKEGEGFLPSGARATPQTRRTPGEQGHAALRYKTG